MEEKRYALIKKGVVYNVCLWDGNLATWTPPNDGTIVVRSDSAGIGDKYNAKEKMFYRPIQSDEE